MKHTVRKWQRWLETLRQRAEGGCEEGRVAAGVLQGIAFRDSLLQVIHDMETAYQSGGQEGCLRTGFPGLDRLTGGLRPGELLVIASASGVGKTMLALNIASHVALSGTGAVALISLESSRRELTQRLLCAHSGVSLNRVRLGGLSPARDFPRLEQSAARLSSTRIFVESLTEPSRLELWRRLRRLKETHDLRLVVIDSLQLLCACQGREDEAAEVARALKRWARELGVVILVAAQLEAPPAHRESGRPVLADLKACRVVEQHADVVALLWRQDVLEPRPELYDPDFSQASLIVAKNRHGALGEVPLLFRKDVPRFENRALEKAES